MTRTVVVPTDAHVQRLLADDGADEPSVTPWRRFVSSTLNRLAPDLGIASSAETRLATRLALDDVAGTLGVPHDGEARVALAYVVDRAIGALRRAGVGHDALRAPQTQRARLIRAAMDRVDEHFARAHLVDPRAIGDAMAERLLHTPSALATREVMARFMVGWDNDDLCALEAVHRVLRERGDVGVTVVLPRLPGAEDAMEAEAERLERRWASLLDAPELEWRQEGHEPRPRQIVEAGSPVAEARSIAAELSGLLSDGLAPERVVVVVPDLDEAAMAPLRAALDDARIPFAEPRGRPATESPEARAALSLLHMARGPVTRDQMIELLRAPGLHSGHWTAMKRELDARARANQLAHRLRDVPVASDDRGDALLENLREVVRERSDEAWMPGAVERMLGTAAWLRDAETRGALTERVLRTFEMLQLGRPSAAELGDALANEERGVTWTGLVASGQASAALTALRDVVSQIGQAHQRLGAGTGATSMGELIAELHHAMGTAPTRPRGAGDQAGAVRIVRPFEICGLGVEAAVVTRFDSRSYGAPAPDAWIDGELRSELPAILRPRAAAELGEVRRAALAWVLGTADTLILTRTRSDELPEPAHPVAEAALARGCAHRVEPASRLSPAASTASPRARALIGLASGVAPTDELERVVAAEREREAFFLDPRRAPAARSGLVDPEPAELEDHLRACIGGDRADRPIAVTAVERLAGCAFAGFAGRALGLRRAEDKSESATPRDRGTLVHRALKAAFETAHGRGFPSDAERWAAAERAAAAAVGSTEAKSPLRREALESAVQDALAVLRWSDEQQSDVHFMLAEQSFGAHSPAPWNALELGPQTSDDAAVSVFVDGQLDRLDATTDGRRVRVIDYKTGSLPTAASAGRTALQLPLYAAVVARRPGAREIEALYVSIRRGGRIETRPSLDRDLRCSIEERNGAMSTARAHVLRAWSGHLAPRPASNKACTHCDVRDLCRRPAVMPPTEEEQERDA